MRSNIAEQFNYVTFVKGQTQTDFVISPYRKPEYLFCSLDVVNAACYLAFIEPEEAKMMSFTPEYFYARRKLKEREEDEDDLVSIVEEDDYGEMSSYGGMTPRTNSDIQVNIGSIQEGDRYGSINYRY